MRKRKRPILEPRHLVRVCEDFLSGLGAQEVADKLNQSLAAEGVSLPQPVNREQVYAFIRDAMALGILVLRPPLETVLNKQIADLYGTGRNRIDAERIEVVDAEGPSTRHFVADRAAKCLMRLIKTVAASKRANGSDDQVHVGLGAGYTSMNIVQHFANEVRAEREVPDLVLHALTSGFSVEHPGTAPVSFFREFMNLRINVGYVGVFAPPVVRSDLYWHEIEQPGAVEAFRRRNEIDIVITSLASEQDDHGDLKMFLQPKDADLRLPGSNGGTDDTRLLKEAGWVGDVMYRPYSSSGPLKREASRRALTLFELSELIEHIGKPNKYLLLVSGPCGRCDRTRADALRPILAMPSLRLWTHLVMCRATAQELLAGPALAPQA